MQLCFLLCQCTSRATHLDFSSSKPASIDLRPCGRQQLPCFNELCMVAAYHQFDSLSLLTFYEQQTQVRRLLHHPLSFFSAKIIIQTRKTRAALCSVCLCRVRCSSSSAVCSCLVCFFSRCRFFGVSSKSTLTVADLLMSWRQTLRGSVCELAGLQWQPRSEPTLCLHPSIGQWWPDKVM